MTPRLCLSREFPRQCISASARILQLLNRLFSRRSEHPYAKVAHRQPAASAVAYHGFRATSIDIGTEEQWASRSSWGGGRGGSEHPIQGCTETGSGLHALPLVSQGAWWGWPLGDMTAHPPFPTVSRTGQAVRRASHRAGGGGEVGEVG